VGAKPIWARGNAGHHADLQSLASNAAQWGTHICRRNRKCSDGAAAVLRSLAAAIRDVPARMNGRPRFLVTNARVRPPAVLQIVLQIVSVRILDART